MEQFPREALCDWAGTTPEIVALYVCGSHVQGTARSDLDLAVEVEGGSFGPGSEVRAKPGPLDRRPPRHDWHPSERP
jgi:predicted nucleotidyltransferase